MCATFPFYFVTLEQYYTGEMNFPPINGIDEGSIVISVAAIVTGFYGNIELWATPHDFPLIGKWRYNQILEIFTLIGVQSYGFSGLY
mgnify:CR=1 FL=1